MKIKRGPIRDRVSPIREVIEILSSSDENEIDAENGSTDDELVDDVISISSNEAISSDEVMEVDHSSDDDRPLDQLVGTSRQSSTDREVSENEIDLDKVRWASSSDDDSESMDQCLELRGPNPMIPGNILNYKNHFKRDSGGYRSKFVF